MSSGRKNRPTARHWTTTPGRSVSPLISLARILELIPAILVLWCTWPVSKMTFGNNQSDGEDGDDGEDDDDAADVWITSVTFYLQFPFLSCHVSL